MRNKRGNEREIQTTKAEGNNEKEEKEKECEEEQYRGRHEDRKREAKVEEILMKSRVTTGKCLMRGKSKQSHG